MDKMNEFDSLQSKRNIEPKYATQQRKKINKIPIKTK